MAISFPQTPTINQTYSSGSSATYQWNGTFWSVITPPSTIFSNAVTASFSQTSSFLLGSQTYLIPTPGNGASTLSGVYIQDGEVWQATFFSLDTSRAQGNMSVMITRSGSYVTGIMVSPTNAVLTSGATGVTFTNQLFANTVTVSSYQFGATTTNLSPPGGRLFLKKLS